MIVFLSMLLGCGEKVETEEYDLYCNQDPEANEVAVDEDCDGVLTEEDCDDTDPNTVNDMDCDEIVAEEDCNDLDAESTIIAEDADCDGIVTDLDCDDSNGNVLLAKTDTDCDGFQETAIVSSGSNHTCAINADNMVECWGADSSGQSGALNMTFSQISSGYVHSCGLTTEGSVECWGASGDDFDYGQVTGAPEGQFAYITSGDFHSCAISVDGLVQCWGYDDDGQSTPPEGVFTSLTAGSAHTCGIGPLGSSGNGDGEIECWGANAQLSSPEGAYGEITAGSYHTCARKTDGTVDCWGASSDGQSTPPDLEEVRFTQISAGGDFTCGLTADFVGDYTQNELLCWGSNDDGQLYSQSKKFLYLSAGQSYVTGLKYDGTLECWGFSNPQGNCEPPEGYSAF